MEEPGVARVLAYSPSGALVHLSESQSKVDLIVPPVSRPVSRARKTDQTHVI